MPAHEGRAAIGLKVHHKQLWVAGGPTGKAFVYDARTGADVAEYALATGTPFINDVAVGRHGRPTSRTRAPPRSSPCRCAAARCAGSPITGDFAADRRRRPPPTSTGSPSRAGTRSILVQTNTGKLFAADTQTGVARAIDLGGPTCSTATGILLRGRTLFVVQNRLNQIAVIHLSRDLARGTIVQHDHRPGVRRADDDRRTAQHLYAVNARFGTTDPQPAKYNVVRVP